MTNSHPILNSAADKAETSHHSACVMPRFVMDHLQGGSCAFVCVAWCRQHIQCCCVVVPAACRLIDASDGEPTPWQGRTTAEQSRNNAAATAAAAEALEAVSWPPGQQMPAGQTARMLLENAKLVHAQVGLQEQSHTTILRVAAPARICYYCSERQCNAHHAVCDCFEYHIHIQGSKSCQKHILRLRLDERSDGSNSEARGQQQHRLGLPRQKSATTNICNSCKLEVQNCERKHNAAEAADCINHTAQHSTALLQVLHVLPMLPKASASKCSLGTMSLQEHARRLAAIAEDTAALQVSAAAVDKDEGAARTDSSSCKLFCSTSRASGSSSGTSSSNGSNADQEHEAGLQQRS